MQLIDGKTISEQIKQEIAAEVAEIVANGGKRPHLAAILVGHDGGSETYVAHKVKACEQCGFKSTLIRHEDDITEEELLKEVERLNDDADIDGFIVQLPLPKHISEQRIIEAIDYRKDVDGFHPINVGRYSCRYHGTTQTIRYRHKRQTLRSLGSQQYRRQAGCHAHDAEKQPGQCHCYRLPQRIEKSERDVPSGRHHHCRPRTTQFRYSRYGERRCCHRRCGNNTCTRRIEKIGFPTQWRCSLRGSSPQMFLHHSRPRRCRPYDHRIAHAQYPVGRQKSYIQITSRV